MRRNKELSGREVPDGRFFVDWVPIPISGAAFCEEALNRGDDNGWKLISVVPSGGNRSAVMIIWDTEPERD